MVWITKFSILDSSMKFKNDTDKTLKNSLLKKIQQNTVGFDANTTLLFTSQISAETEK